MGKIKFFQDLKAADNPHVVSQCLKDLKLQENTKGQHLMNFGEIGLSFYIVISGCFDVFVPIKGKVALTNL